LEIEAGNKKISLKPHVGGDSAGRTVTAGKLNTVKTETTLSNLGAGNSGILKEYTVNAICSGRCLSLGFTPAA